ncbi:MAG: hypothetical protein HRT58_20465 [Crocinitomicaceae bacterium]|nr:hypothetical protein [Flavobacteriales bacterium]NQZ38045.1 hypothetical protein [Crocinitomicaceae bacterium]
MIFRLILLFSFLLAQFTIFSQTFDWNNTKNTQGSISFDNLEINFLIVKFEATKGTDRANQIYNQNLEKFQNELEELLEASELNYELILRSQLDDSTYIDTEKYPVVIDHEVYMRYMNDMNYSYLRLLVRDRKSKVQVSVDPVHQATKYVKSFRKFITKMKKGKSMQMKIA